MQSALREDGKESKKKEKRKKGRIEEHKSRISTEKQDKNRKDQLCHFRVVLTNWEAERQECGVKRDKGRGKKENLR
jgi:hypothetical protein